MLSQSESSSWLVQAHTRAEQTRCERAREAFDEEGFRAGIARRIARFGCDESKIAFRGHELADCGHTRWSDMSVYRLCESPAGEGSLTRTRMYSKLAAGLVERLHPESESPPADLLHVTCTGYESPSAAQRIVAARGWGEQTRVTHAYHMGCYASIPALRLASALCASGEVSRARADVLHLELCSLHLNPTLRTPEQMVVQTLFADGAIKYSVSREPPSNSAGPVFSVLALAERILPDSAQAITWACADAGMQMTLARDVPELVAARLSEFVDGLCRSAALSDHERSSCLFAVHPGGPRILDSVEDVLRLEGERIDASRAVLRERGNMSSATLPFVWMRLLNSAQVADGRVIVSLAFGPGLTLCGAVLRKVSS